MYVKIMQKLFEKKKLDKEEMSFFSSAVINKEISDVQVSAMLTAMSAKGFEADEIVEIAKILMTMSKGFETSFAMDNCGTGGSGYQRFNVSTVSAFVLASGGVRVAKHGNYASSGRVGSFDLLDELSIPFSFSPEESKKILEKKNLVFLFAPFYHPSMKNVAKIRKELQFKTIFNILGPLLNPANVSSQIVGTTSKKIAKVIAKSLKKMGRERFLVVCGDGIDEITISGDTVIFEYDIKKGDEIFEKKVSPEDFGIKKVEFDEILGGDLKENAAIAEEILLGNKHSAKFDMVALNAGAGFYLMGITSNIKDGFEKAKNLLLNGEVYKKFIGMQSLEKLKNISS